MRATVAISLLSSAILAGGACRNKSDAEKQAARSSTPVQKTAEQATAEPRDELDQANRDLASARDHDITAAKERLSRLDAKIEELEARADVKAKELAAKARAESDELETRIENAKTVTLEPSTDTNAAQDKYDINRGWKSYLQDLDSDFEKLEKEINDALR